MIRKMYFDKIDKKDYLLYDNEAMDLIILNNAEISELEYRFDKHDNDIINITDKTFIQKLNSKERFCNNLGRLKKLSIIVTNECNLACLYCYANKGSYNMKKQILNSNNMKKIIDFYFSKYNIIESILFFGGEPLINYEVIEEVIKYIDEKYLKQEIEVIPTYNIVTNGTMLNRKIMNFIKKYNFYITISLDFPEDIHDLNRVYKGSKGTYKDILSNLKKIKKVLNNNLSIELTYSMSHQDKGIDLVKLYKMLISSEIPVNSLILGYVNSTNSEQEKFIDYFRSSYIDLLKYYLDLLASSKLDNLINIVAFDNILRKLINKEKKDYLCPIIRYSQIVFPNLDIYPCQFYTDERFRIGNVKYGYNEKYNKMLNKYSILNSNARSSNCKYCWNYDFCNLCPGTMKIDKGLGNSEEVLIDRKSCLFNKEISRIIFRKISKIYNTDEKYNNFCNNFSC